MKHREDILKGIEDIFNSFSKGNIPEAEIKTKCDLYIKILGEMDEPYLGMRTEELTDDVLEATDQHIK